ncbi:MAG: MFS transporter [Chroococcidiopsidaceae cyanobacterium CP_BM_ER_R8_30]|nr:MFS transporter [Chroococcidiopsidaceae cyanobacterium CP_BM_ER_R8_30]
MRRKNSHPAWIGIALAFYAFIAIGIAEGGLGVLLPSILQTYHLTPATVTALFLSQMTGYIIAAMTSSLLSSLMGLARMLLLAAIVLTSALIMYAITPHWFVMVACGILLGLGIGLIDAGINTFIAKQENANLMGMLHAFYGIGALSGPTLATTLLALEVDWRQVYLVVAGVVGVTIVGMLWAVLQRYQPMMVRLSTDTNPVANLQSALHTPIVLVAGLLLLIYVGTEVSIGNWAYTVQHVSRGIPNWIAGYSISSYWLGLTLGRLGTGQMVKVLGANRTIDFSLALLLLGLLIWWLLPNQELSFPLMGLALAAIFPTLIWSMPQRLPAAMVPAAIGFLASVGSLGAALVPTVIGWIANALSLAVIPALLIPLAVLMMILHRGLVRETSSR